MRSATPSVPRRDEAGVTLIEIMVVLVVVSVGVLALSGVQMRSSADVYSTGRHTRALQVAQQKMEIARGGGFALAVSDSEVKEFYKTDNGKMYQATVEDFLASPRAKELKGKVQLIFTSPPFPLLTPKKYGNRVGDDYLKWLSDLAPRLRVFRSRRL